MKPLERLTKRCIDPTVHLPWAVDLPEWKQMEMGKLGLLMQLQVATEWCRLNCRDLYTAHARHENGQVSGCMFEFANQEDALWFKMTWG